MSVNWAEILVNSSLSSPSSLSDFMALALTKEQVELGTRRNDSHGSYSPRSATPTEECPSGGSEGLFAIEDGVVT